APLPLSPPSRRRRPRRPAPAGARISKHRAVTPPEREWSIDGASEEPGSALRRILRAPRGTPRRAGPHPALGVRRGRAPPAGGAGSARRPGHTARRAGATARAGEAAATPRAAQSGGTAGGPPREAADPPISSGPSRRAA